MSLENRTTSAYYKRAEQLRRWEESDTNREIVTATKQISRKVKFSSGCVFLAACAAGDKDEVVKLLQKGADINTANVDGLTALHQACIDDNLDMVEFLVEHGADVNRGDNEGWTPLHATASCGLLYIAKYLLEKGANVAAVNNDGELPLDIAESQKMEDLLKEEIDKLGIDCEAARNEEQMIMLRDAKDWLATKSSLVNVPHPKTGATPLHVASAKGYVDVIKILLQCGADIDAQDVDGWSPIHAAAHWGQKEVCQLLVENYADLDAKNFVGQTASDLCDPSMSSYLEDLRKKQNKEEVNNRRQAKKRSDDIIPEAETPIKVKKVEVPPENELKPDITSEKQSKSNSLPAEKTTIAPPTTLSQKTDDSDENMSWKKVTKPTSNDLSPTKTSITSNISVSSSDFSNDTEVTIRIPANIHREKDISKDDNTESNSVTSSSNASSEKASPATSPQPSNQQPLRRSFVPPVRDEESETQRKAHAKRVRETRRSTQGVTLEEIKSAEQFVKSKNGTNNNNAGETPTSNRDSANGVVVSTTITTATPTIKTTRETEDPPVTHERRPSWRLRVDNGTSKFELEDASKQSELPSSASFTRRANTTTVPVSRPSSAPLDTAETTVTIPLRRPKSIEEKEQDKENDIRNAQATLATQAAIQRRRRPKRRSTGVVSFDGVDDQDQEKDPSNSKDCDETAKSNHVESGTDRSSRSRISSTSDIRNENGEIDYKKLYEQQLVENDRLKEKLRKSDEELRETKQTLEKISLVTSKNSLSELEKRERRAMERKLSEMEEELKQLQKLKAENERLKADNRSLTRVVNKLTNSAKK